MIVEREKGQNRMKSVTTVTFLPALLLLLLLTHVSQVQSRPEIIREGLSYYSDEYIQTGVIRDIGAEKNIEEVYQFYTYYEAVYDTKQRVINFREYKQGNVIYEEQYVYDDEGPVPARKTVLIPGQEPEVIPLDKSN